MILCSLRNVTQIIGANTIFQDINLEIKQGERIGLIGRNGEGKTSLLNLISKESDPAIGVISWKKELRTGLLKQIAVTEEEKQVQALLYDVFENLNKIREKMTELEQRMAAEKDPAKLERHMEIYGTLLDKFQQDGGYEMDAQVRQVLNGLQMTELENKKWHQLSGGEKTKVGLAQLLLKAPDLLLLDEPTNHLDFLAIEWLTSFIKHYEGTVIIVSHDRYFLDETVTSILEMDQGELIKYHTNYTDYVKEREARLLREFQQYEDQQKKIKKMKETIKRLKEWANQANPPNDGLHRRAKSMQKALDRLTVVKRPVLDQKKINLDFEMESRSGKEVLKLDSVSKRFGNQRLYEELSMLVRFQERIALIGENGTGKSTLLHLMLGTENADQGMVKQGSNLSIGYLSQHMLEMDANLTVLDEFREHVAVTEGEARRILASFLFYGPNVFKKVRQLSGGEKMRLRLAELVYQKHNLLLLDEPTNHLDIESKEVLEEALEQFEGTIITVSHDRYFLDRLFPVTYLLADQKLTRFEGNYTFARGKWLEKNES
ncbi:ABC transporter ATP-binding protein [Oceanobacillus picturae]|uniref:ABC transporter ATP-binding protein n=1 Tax=Oceanobacillus picturae TaxID=171693 RepID=W9AM80_9BACI|nr:ABC-F family ATP-binding cassette domain-containing protein [Oceanobacillus picturae]RIU91877.1 ABC transporter ATP-binding protein [Oceanobacillus picturae]GAQ16587.1 ABC transporter ATP-binding protein [Oceanobacillus picturae]CDO04012.1 putative ABC transporter ATP-binding protein [Oceanobacillus picturae]